VLRFNRYAECRGAPWCASVYW
jgi:hypothetical protein